MRFLLIFLVGCTPAGLAKYAETTRDVLELSEPCIVAQVQASAVACGSDAACLGEVQARADHIADLFDAVHVAWCTLSPESDGCAK